VEQRRQAIADQAVARGAGHHTLRYPEL